MKYVAFLRAINVGGRVVTMDRLRSLFEEMGLSAVETFIASGNVLFESSSRAPASLERQIGTHLRQALGYEVAVFVRSSQQLSSILEFEPFSGDRLAEPAATLFIVFLSAPATPAVVDSLRAAQTPTDAFRVHAGELYWLLRGSFHESAFSGPRLEELLGMPATVRNANTIRRIVARSSVARGRSSIQRNRAPGGTRRRTR